MGHIFVSYKKEDRDHAAVLARALEAYGWKVWWDRSIAAGKRFDDVIEEAIDAASCVIVLWTSRSVRSDWVRNEAQEGANRGVLVPILIEDVKIPLAFRRIQAADLIGWRGDPNLEAFQRLCQDIEAVIGAPVADEARAERPGTADKPEARTSEPAPTAPDVRPASVGGPLGPADASPLPGGPDPSGVSVPRPLPAPPPPRAAEGGVEPRRIFRVAVGRSQIAIAASALLLLVLVAGFALRGPNVSVESRPERAVERLPQIPPERDDLVEEELDALGEATLPVRTAALEPPPGPVDRLTRLEEGAPSPETGPPDSPAPSEPAPPIVEPPPAPADSAEVAPAEPVAVGAREAQQYVSQSVRPDYPEAAQEAGIDGNVVLRVWISSDGDVRDVVRITGPDLLTGAAIDAVRQWRYAPYRQYGMPVDIVTTVTVGFTLTPPESPSRSPEIAAESTRSAPAPTTDDTPPAPEPQTSTRTRAFPPCASPRQVTLDAGAVTSFVVGDDTFGLYLGSVRPNLVGGGGMEVTLSWLRTGEPWWRSGGGEIDPAELSSRLSEASGPLGPESYIHIDGLTEGTRERTLLGGDRWVELRFLDMRGRSAQFAICGQ